MCKRMWQREKQARSPCNSVCEGTNTHLYDNFLFTMSKDSNTDTIHFPFINWCRNVVFRRSDFWSLLGLKGGRVCFTGGWRELLVVVVGVDYFRSHASIIVCIWDNMLSFHEHLAATAWDPGSKLVSSDDTFALSKKIIMVCHLSQPLAKFQYYISFLHYLFAFHVWHPESSPVNHSDIQFTRIDDMSPVCHFYVALVPFLFSIIRDSSSRQTDIANYFQISGGQFQFQLSLVFSSDLRVGEQGCALSPEKFWVPFKRRF